MHPMPLQRRWDVVVAGARCAGASTALLLARRGARVLVVDPAPPGRDTLSTHALMRGAVTQLHRWGLLDRLRAAGTPAIRATTFDYPDQEVRVEIEARGGVDALYAPRRTVLDGLLQDAAREAGATVLHGLSVVDLVRTDAGRVSGAVLADANGGRHTVEADLVVGADGVRSKVARLVEAPVVRQGRHATAAVYGYWRGIDQADTRWYFRPTLGMGAIPTNGGATCVFLSVTPKVFREAGARGMADLLVSSARRVDPALARGLSSGARIEGVRGFAGLRGFLRRAVGPGWALVGDAGYFRDPLTAHGITDALRDAELLAGAATAGTDGAFAGYERTRDAAALGLMRVTDAIASLQWTIPEVKELHHRLAREMKVASAALRRADAA
ncbi:MAG: NAD(P)/FAD-dependent oxidoreductase [Longimicrobiales bacterium]